MEYELNYQRYQNVLVLSCYGREAVIVVFDNNWLIEKDVTQDMVYYYPLFNYMIHHSVHNYVCGSSSNKGVIIRCPT